MRSNGTIALMSLSGIEASSDLRAPVAEPSGFLLAPTGSREIPEPSADATRRFLDD
jgi:hypothetical protein